MPHESALSVTSPSASSVASSSASSVAPPSVAPPAPVENSVLEDSSIPLDEQILDEQQPKKICRKRQRDDIVDDMLIRNLSNLGEANDNEDELFGRQVAATLRFTNRQKATAKLCIQSVLVDVEFPAEDPHCMSQMYGLTSISSNCSLSLHPIMDMFPRVFSSFEVLVSFACRLPKARE